MTYVVTEDCIRCKYQDCVEVCPVDAFFEGENMLVISPDECIDCGVCEPECPAEAVLPDNLVDERWVALNEKYSKIWPLISQMGKVPDDADDFMGVADKFEQHFSEAPGVGDG